MRILMVAPERSPNVVEIDGSLKSMQEVVGGTIQAIYPFDEEVALVANDEGKLLGLPLNRALRNWNTGEIYDLLVGNFFLCGAPADQDHFTSLSEAQIGKYRELFRYPEMFFQLNGRIVAVPIKKV